jgi:hypothetical protein
MTESNIKNIKNRKITPIIVGGNNGSKSKNITQMKTMYKKGK